MPNIKKEHRYCSQNSKNKTDAGALGDFGGPLSLRAGGAAFRTLRRWGGFVGFNSVADNSKNKTDAGVGLIFGAGEGNRTLVFSLGS